MLRGTLRKADDSDLSSTVRTLMSVISLTLILAGCDSLFWTEPPSVEIVEIGGITVVVNPLKRRWEDETGWSATEEWRTEGGTLEFGRVSGLAAHPDGSVVLMDTMERVVVVLDVDGNETARFGNAGEGPGQFGLNTPSIYVSGAGIVHVPDSENGRIIRFTIDGDLLESQELPDVDGVPLRWSARAGSDIYSQWLTPSGQLLIRLGGANEPADTILRLLPPSRRVDGESTPWNPLATAPLWVVLGNGEIAFARTSEYRLQFVSEDGWVTRTATGPDGRFSVPKEPREILDSLWKERARRIPGTSPPRLPPDSTWDLPELMPALTSLLLGPHGSIWARRSPPLVRVNPRGLGSSDYGLLGGDEWDVFDGEGVYLGSIHLPDQLRLPIVHGNRIIGVIRGDSDKDIVVSILLAGFSGVRDQTGGA